MTDLELTEPAVAVPAHGAGGVPGGLRLAAIRHARFGPSTDWLPLGQEATFWAERLPGYGLAAATLDDLRGNRNSYADMGRRLLADLHLAAGAPDVPPDLVIVAHALPDTNLSDSVGGNLADWLVGHPLVFALSDQGRATPYAALRIAQAHSALLTIGGLPSSDRSSSDGVGSATGLASAAILILDQGTLFYDDPALHGLDTRTDHGVGLLLAPGGAIAMHPVRQLPQVPPARVPDLIAAQARELDPDPATITVLAGAGVPALPPGLRGPARRAPAGQLCTSAWTALAAELATPRPADRAILVAEYDPALRYLCLAAFDVPAGQTC